MLKLKNVVYVLEMDSNLLSDNVLVNNGFRLSIYLIRGTNILINSYILVITVFYDKLKCLKIVNNRVINTKKFISILKTIGWKHIILIKLQKLLYDI